MATKISQGKDSHFMDVMTRFQLMRAREVICDFVVQVADDSFSVHRVVLAACTDYFQAMFAHDTKEAHRGKVLMKDMTADSVKQCIDFMYTGEFCIKMADVKDLLHASNLLQLNKMVELCFQFIEDNLAVENCLFVWRLVQTYTHEKLGKVAENLAIDNFEWVISTDGFFGLEEKELVDFITESNTDYRVSWEAVMTWIKHDPVRKQRLQDLMKLTNIESFPFKFLISTVWVEPKVQESENCKKMVVAGLLPNLDDFKQNIDIENCFLLKRLVEINPHPHGKEAREIIVRFMVQEFEKIWQNEEFLTLSEDDFSVLMKETKEQSREMAKWNAMLKWTKHVSRRKKTFLKLFKLIDLRLLPTQFLRNVVRKEQLVKESTKCLELLLDASFAVDATPQQLHAATDLPTTLQGMGVAIGLPATSQRMRADTSVTETSHPIGANAGQAATSRQTTPHFAVLDHVTGVIKGFDIHAKSWRNIARVEKSKFLKVVSVNAEDLYVLSENNLLHLEKNETWTRKASLRQKPSVYACVLEFQNNIYVLDRGKLSRYDVKENSWTENLPGKILECQISAAATERYIFAKDGISVSTFKYDPEEQSWSSVASRSYPSLGILVTSMCGNIYLIEDYNVRRYDSITDKWVFVPNMYRRRHPCSACSLGNKLYVVASDVNAIFQRLEQLSIEVHDEKTNRWTILTHMARPKGKISSCVIRLPL